MRHPAIIIACVLSLAACSAPDDTGPATASVPPAGRSATAHPIDANTGNATAEAAVRQIVVRFGTQLKMVSTLAPPDSIRKQIRVAYAGLVAPQLMQAWEKDPSKAPGKDVSSPWPQSIDISDIACASASTCSVKGSVRYVTSDEVAHGGVFNRRKITLKLQRGEQGWRIVAVSM